MAHIPLDKIKCYEEELEYCLRKQVNFTCALYRDCSKGGLKLSCDDVIHPFIDLNQHPSYKIYQSYQIAFIWYMTIDYMCSMVT